MFAPILTYPNPLLRKPCAPVSANDIKSGKVVKWACEMIESLEAGNGVGLAAPQIGILKRMIAIKVLTPKYGWAGIMVNPVILSKSDIKTVYKEGCLSFPEKFIDIERPAIVTVSYDDVNGYRKMGAFHDLAAKCIQHEIDHLDGILFIDHEGKSI
jgi:peptide deformylase